MDWSQQFPAQRRPAPEDMDRVIRSRLWRELNDYLQQVYGTAPQMAYSGCSAQPGWNVKYKKGGKSLCTLYPMEGFFLALVVVGAKEEEEARLLMPFCCADTQALFADTAFSMGGRWLMLQVTDDQVLEDVKALIRLRVKPKL